MCGIAGIFHSGSGARADADEVRRMVSALRHRGPDDEGLFVQGPVGLGARRLKVIDLDRGRQPLFNEDRSIAVVFNGEIYNFRGLRDDLIARGHRFQTQSDTEVIVHAYEEYGEECVQHLRGMFAFALWDGVKRTLFLARDRIGIKPLYYSWDGRTFLFGSEIKALLQCAATKREIDPLALDDYFTFNSIPAPKSIFRSIRKLLPAHTLRVSASGVSEHEYWDLVFEPDHALDEDAWATGLRHRLRESVRLHLESDVPLGAFLSGGVDSSAVSVLASELAAKPIDTFSIGFEDRDFDELPFARLVTRDRPTLAHEQILRPEAARSVDLLTWHYDEPFADSSMVPTYHVSRLARARVTVCLAGDGGDELFAGYPRFFEFQERSLLDPAAAERHYFRQRTWLTPAMKNRLYGSWLQQALKDYDPFSVWQPYFERVRSCDPVSRIQYLEIKTYLPNDLLTKVDRASMAHGLEVRVPLLDHELMAYAARIPAGLQLRQGKGKYIFKQALRNLLPAAILSRPKMGFSMPLARWWRRELKGFFEQYVLASDAFLSAWLDLKPLRAWWAEHQQGGRDYNRFFWALLVLECWAQRFLAGKSDPSRPGELFPGPAV